MVEPTGHVTQRRHSATAPRAVLRSAGPALESALRGGVPRLIRIDDLEVVLVLPVESSDLDGGRLACYVVEPDHRHPIAHISLFSEHGGHGGRALGARFRIRAGEDLGRFEFVVLPAGLPGGAFLRPSVARSVMCGEIRLRAAIRLALRGERADALARLGDSEREYRSAREPVPAHYWERLGEIRRRIDQGDAPDGLLADSVEIDTGPDHAEHRWAGCRSRTPTET